MDSRRDGLTPRTSMMVGSKQPTVTPPRSMAGNTTPYAGAGNYNNAPSEFSDLDLALQQKLVRMGNEDISCRIFKEPQ